MNNQQAGELLLACKQIVSYKKEVKELAAAVNGVGIIAPECLEIACLLDARCFYVHSRPKNASTERGYSWARIRRRQLRNIPEIELTNGQVVSYNSRDINPVSSLKFFSHLLEKH